MGRTNKRWSYSAGERGRNRVRVYEDARSRSILMEVHEHARRIRKALGHNDRDRAKREADRAAAQLDSAEEQLEPDILRVGALFEQYLGEVTPNKSLAKQKHDQRASRMFTEFLGTETSRPSIDGIGTDSRQRGFRAT